MGEQMGRPDECASLLKNGYNPREIASELGISIGSVMQYLFIKVGKGDLNRSEILFSIKSEIRQDFEEVIQQTEIEEQEKEIGMIKEISWSDLCKAINNMQIEVDDVDFDLFKIFFELRRPKVWLGDLYWNLYSIESTLHKSTEALLKVKYGAEESGWWRKIPLVVRQECQKRREEDSNPANPFTYTDLIDLQKIFEKEWAVLSYILTKILKDKKRFREYIGKLNYIRNKVMHPVKEPPTIEDFIFVREFQSELTEGIQELIQQIKDEE